jgi:hypothetical protein
MRSVNVYSILSSYELNMDKFEPIRHRYLIKNKRDRN